MKTTFALAGLTLALCSLLPAQDSGRVVVPARNSSRPRKVNVHVMNGAITVKAYTGKEVIVESDASTRRTPRRGAVTTPDGLHRIDIPLRGLTVEEEDNQITVRMPDSGGSLTLNVPADTSLDLHSMSGAVNVEGVKGEIVVDTMNGRIALNNVSGNVLAHSQNGQINVAMDTVDTAKPLSFTTMNGTIDVTLPANYKGNVKMSSNHGAIYTDFEFKLGGGVITQSNNTSEGKFKVQIGNDRALSGTINGGGPEATFKSFNGSIYIRKKK